MIDSFKKGLRIGIGLSVMTSKQIDKTIKAVVKKQKVNARQARVLVKTLKKEVEKSKRKFNNVLDKETKAKLKELGMSSTNDAKKFIMNVKAAEKNISAAVNIQAKVLGNKAISKVKKKVGKVSSRTAKKVKKKVTRAASKVAKKAKKTVKSKLKKATKGGARGSLNRAVRAGTKKLSKKKVVKKKVVKKKTVKRKAVKKKVVKRKVVKRKVTRKKTTKKRR